MVQKIFRKDVARISADKFGEARIMVEGQSKKVRPAELKKITEKKSEGGITLTQLDKELREEGMEWAKRKRMLKTIGGGEKSLHEQKVEKEKAEEKGQILAQQGKTIAELRESREDPLKKALTTASGEKIGHEALGIESKYKDARTTALRPNSNQGQRASIRQEEPSPVSVAGGFGIVKKPLESKPNNVIKGNFGGKGSLQGKPPIGFRKVA